MEKKIARLYSQLSIALKPFDVNNFLNVLMACLLSVSAPQLLFYRDMS